LKGTVSQALTYNGLDAFIDSSTGRNAASTGAESITVTGKNLAGGTVFTANIRAGATACQAVEWTSDTVSRIKLASGQEFVPSRLYVSVLDSPGLENEPTFMYNRATAARPTQNVPATGAVSVTLFGANF